MKAASRAIVRARRDAEARERIGLKHVEFCSVCGKPVDRTGRRVLSTCINCSKEARAA